MSAAAEGPGGGRAKERSLIERMIRFACEHQHGNPQGQLCANCAHLLEYACERIARCPYGEDKPTCRNCPIHCYRPDERAQIKEIMKFAGPRLLVRGDLDAIKHLLHDRHPVPPRPVKPDGAGALGK